MRSAMTSLTQSVTENTEGRSDDGMESFTKHGDGGGNGSAENATTAMQCSNWAPNASSSRRVRKKPKKMNQDPLSEVFRLKVEPELIVFSGNLDEQDVKILTICNRTNSAMAFKIRCTSNETFRIRPSIGIVSEKSVEVKIFYKGNETKPGRNHHITIYHIPSPHGATADGVWEEHYGPAQGRRRFDIILSSH